MTDDLNKQALRYHRVPTAGKIDVVPSKPLANQHDMALAYSPGVAAACEAIVDDPLEASTVTARGNLVAVISNGTAVLGLGAIGPLAAKPVMEGKGVLFKKFAGINVFDIEVNERDPQKLVEIIASLEPSFGGINLEDIKAPECFYVEHELRKRMRIPVFHDDQHGTAIIAAAAVLNGLQVVGKNIAEVRLVTSGAGAAGMACLDLLRSLGMRREHIVLCDSRGVVYTGRGDKDERKLFYAAETSARTLADAVAGADIFLGVSAPGVLTPEMVKTMSARALILALANPIPEIMPELAREAQPESVIATGRSDYSNQVNNVLCFPYIFRGALDVGATTINEEMKLACVRALADLARKPASDTDQLAAAYGDQSLTFGPDYLIPKPFDPRLVVELPTAVARTAMETGVATRPIEDFAAYREKLAGYVYRSGMIMRPVFERAKTDPKRVVFAEGENDQVLRAVQTVVDERLARPVLIGHQSRITERLETLGLRISSGEDFDLVDPVDNPDFEEIWRAYHRLRERDGVEPDDARTLITTRATILGAMLVHLGYADTMLCGMVGPYSAHLREVKAVLGVREGVTTLASVNTLLTLKGPLCFCDTNVNPDPSAEEIADITLLAADAMQYAGILHPKVALLSSSNFGTQDVPQALKMAKALKLIRQRAPDLEIEGEMRGDVALSETLRQRLFPHSRLQGMANLLIMPNRDAANITFTVAKTLTDSVAIGPILLGLGKPTHILSKVSTVRRIINMTAIAVMDAQRHAESSGQESML